MASALTGPALLEKVKSLGGVPKAAAAEACGYVRTVKKGDAAGSIVPATEKFLAALAEAQGIKFGPPSRGFTSTGLLRVGTSQHVVIGATHLRKLGAEPGDTVSVEVIEDAGEIVLSLNKADSNGNGAKV